MELIDLVKEQGIVDIIEESKERMELKDKMNRCVIVGIHIYFTVKDIRFYEAKVYYFREKARVLRSRRPGWPGPLINEWEYWDRHYVDHINRLVANCSDRKRLYNRLKKNRTHYVWDYI